MECSEEKTKVVKLSYEEWTPLLGKVIREILKTNGVDVNGSKTTLRIVGNNEKPGLHFTFTTAKQLLDETKEGEKPTTEGGEEEMDDLEFLSEPVLS